jgi:hypothetical protein
MYRTVRQLRRGRTTANDMAGRRSELTGTALAANARKSAALRAKRQNVMPATSEPGAPVKSDFIVT